MSNKYVVVLLAAAALTTSACATVTRGKTEEVKFTSAPSGAAVTTSMGASCTTPCIMTVKRKQAFSAAFQRGQQKRMVKVAVKTSGEGVAAGAGNIFAGGLIGVAVDAGSGATLDHVPNPVHVDFSKPQSQTQAMAEAHAKAVRLAEAKAKAKERAKTERKGSTR